MNEVHVVSDRQLYDRDIAQIASIMEISECPNESLINSFKGCKGINGTMITIGDAPDYQYTVCY